jgi:predicted RNase H-like HicB family nuclease
MFGTAMVEEMSKYDVVYERGSDGYWTASVKGVRGCHTQGRSIEQAEHRIREALGLYVDDADQARLVRHIRLPRHLRHLVGGVLRLKSREEQAFEEYVEHFRFVAAKLRAERISVRDVTALLGKSKSLVSLRQKEQMATATIRKTAKAEFG